MKLKIEKIVDRGVVNKERLWLKVLQNTNLQYYIVFDTMYISPDSISSLQRNAYWFGKNDVSSGDNVILYTTTGTPSTSKNNDGTTTYFYYWNLPKTIWNKKEDCAVLFEITGWETSKYE